MPKKFLEGLVFGCGFAIAFLLISYLAAFFATPVLVAQQISPVWSSGSAQESGAREMEAPFHALTLDEQIARASVIAVVGFEPESEGRIKAVFSEFLKNELGENFRYGIGDEYPPASYYPRDRMDRGAGQVVFFAETPPVMQLATTYSGDRIRGLGDIPLALLRQKCREAGAR